MPEIQVTYYDQAERAAWLRLARTNRVGPITFHKLLQRFGTPSEALKAIPTLSSRGKAKPLSPPSFDDVDSERKALGKLGGCFVYSCDQHYPMLLRQTPDPPPVLSVLGDPALLNKEQVAIVGSRNASANGTRMATALANDLSQRGLVITSGLARGIDTATHKASIATGTIAVVAGGVDIIYPPESEELYHSIKTGNGAIISEVPLGIQPVAQSFPRRNRIIAGLSLGTIVIEANKRSGSLITARIANELGREVMAVPGSPLDPRSSGANHILQQGATLITSGDDVFEALRSSLDLFAHEPENTISQPIPLDFDSAEIENLTMELIELLSSVPTDINDLVRQTGTPAHWVQAALVELELSGQIQREGNQHVMLISPTSADVNQNFLHLKGNVDSTTS